MDPYLPPSFTPGRKWRIGLNVIFSALLLVVVLGMVNYLSNRFHYRWTAGAPPLSATTRHLLNTLTNDVKVIVYYDREDDLFSSVSTLLHQFKLQSPRLQVEFVDHRLPGRAQQIRETYKFVDQSDGNRIIFDAQNRVKVVHDKELSVYDTDAAIQGRPIRRTAFRGEQLFSSAIYSVCNAEQPKVYFLTGHGEHDSEDKRQDGYSRFREILEQNNVEVREFNALLRSDVPLDCDLLIIPGPVEPLQPIELERLSRYLAAPGRLMVMYRFNTQRIQTGLDALLLQYGIEVGQGVVADSTRAQAGDETVLVLDNFGVHPIATPLDNSAIAMAFPRPVTAREGKGRSADAANAVNLLLTSEDGTVTARGQTRKGNFSVAAASEKGAIAGVSSLRNSTRIVATGDALFLSNVMLDQAANYDFANLAVNWLLNRELLLGDIPPRAIEEYRLSLTRDEMKEVRLFFLVVAPGAALLIGAIVWFRRRF
ncbi:MAG TPA: GldG family protein [Methylomirabilota bacterium]|nr:GldG family protein [Methylomirabilota bacterium]